MGATRNVYKVIRSIIFTVILTVVGLYTLLYTALSVPAVQQYVGEVAERELSKLLGTHVSIGHVSLSLGGEVQLQEVEVPCPDGTDFASIDKLGAGIDLGELIFKRRIVFTFAEIIGLDGHLRQEKKDGPWNPQFLVDALSPKDKTKPPTQFDIKLRNVVIRKSRISVDKDWAALPGSGRMDFNHLLITDLSVDAILPRLKNDDFAIELRRLSFREKSGFELERLTANVHITPHQLDIDNLSIRLPGTYIEPGEFHLAYNGYNEIGKVLKNRSYDIRMQETEITPSDFAAFLPTLRDFREPIRLTLDARCTLTDFNIRRFLLDARRYGLSLMLAGRLSNPADNGRRKIIVDKFNLDATSRALARFTGLVPNLPPQAKGIITRLGDVRADFKGHLIPGETKIDLAASTAVGSVKTRLQAGLKGFMPTSLTGDIETPGFDLGHLLDNPKFGTVIARTHTDLRIASFTLDGINGLADIDLQRFDFNGKTITNVLAHLTKEGKNVSGEASINDSRLTASLNGDAVIDGMNSIVNARLETSGLNPASFASTFPQGYLFTGRADIALNGIDPGTFTGSVGIADLHLESPKGPLDIPYINVEANHELDDNGRGLRRVTLDTPYANAEVYGHYDIARLPKALRSLFSQAMPALLPGHFSPDDYLNQEINLGLTVHPDNTLTEYFGLPVTLLTPVTVNGYVDGDNSTAHLSLFAPYIQQGKDKLIRNTFVTAQINGTSHAASLQAGTVLPGKDNTDVDLNLSFLGINNNLEAYVMWDLNRPTAYRGKVGMTVDFSRDPVTNATQFGLRVMPSQFQVADAVWDVAQGTVDYSDGVINVNGVSVGRGDQFVNINGRASKNPDDRITVDLSKIDLDYIFETLKINYVTFGGKASGRAFASNVFRPDEIIARTDGLKVQDLTYNGGLLGDSADLFGEWLPKQKKVAIGAEISEAGKHRASVKGGVWLGRDSLAFDMDTKKVNIAFMQPFMSAFASDLKGRASGKVKLYGTFSDIDLTGRVFADTIAMKVDYTNVVYSGSDSVYLDPGRIRIPSFRLYDRNGNSGILSGELTHRYFHEPKFNFTVKNARNLLCYNTNEKMNPDWYGTIYGNGGGQIRGVPGYVGIMVDMAVAPKSVFTFVLNDRVAAGDYNFLTFTDRRKQAEEEEREQQRMQAQTDTVLENVRRFIRQRERRQEEENRPSVFDLDIRASVTPESEMILVMDPVGGDKIRAHGNGSLQLGYNSSTEEMDMYGTYTLTDGTYNFTLQDIILKDFTIRPGSSIAFNGDPLKATVDISAIYRVNANLTDLDKSFASDRDLNRTNVPVDAVLSVVGDLQSPQINLDIELPTLTQDAERKVKSIISTEDMMSRQIIYLLALNRFYTPEYMGSSSNGGEWASVASATVASQLQNMLAQLTDKFTLAPTFRTDKGDFSDMEFDVALSSRLLNNRLLINGNLGYRDKATSNTTFVGDFDIEYLLNRSGNLRLKAYNHYNDQNYYLKSALTTQGIGIIYRKDFDNIFKFLRPKKKKKPEEQPVTPDTLPALKPEEPAPQPQ